MAGRLLAMVFIWLASGAAGELQSLFPRSAPSPVSHAAPGSLFAGAEAGLFRAALRPHPALTTPHDSNRIDRLLTLIARAEAGPANYDAVQHGARILPPGPPTALTLAEIDAWIDATPGQPHAIGRYQFIPATLRRLVRAEELPAQTRFTPDVQDRLAIVLLEEAGLKDFESGTLPRARFMHSLARIWAGLPLPNGRSYYHGYAGNKATMSWATFDGSLRAIWPDAG